MSLNEEKLKEELAHLEEQSKKLDRLIAVLFKFAEYGMELYSVPIMDKDGTVWHHLKRPEYDLLSKDIEKLNDKEMETEGHKKLEEKTQDGVE